MQDSRASSEALFSEGPRGRDEYRRRANHLASLALRMLPGDFPNVRRIATSRQAEVKARRLEVYQRIVLHMASRGTTSWIESEPTWARVCELPRSAFNRHLTALAQLGLVEVRVEATEIGYERGRTRIVTDYVPAAPFRAAYRRPEAMARATLKKLRGNVPELERELRRTEAREHARAAAQELRELAAEQPIGATMRELTLDEPRHEEDPFWCVCFADGRLWKAYTDEATARRHIETGVAQLLDNGRVSNNK